MRGRLGTNGGKRAARGRLRRCSVRLLSMDAFVRESIKMACDCSSDGRLGEAQRELQ